MSIFANDVFKERIGKHTCMKDKDWNEDSELIFLGFNRHKNKTQGKKGDE